MKEGIPSILPQFVWTVWGEKKRPSQRGRSQDLARGRGLSANKKKWSSDISRFSDLYQQANVLLLRWWSKHKKKAQCRTLYNTRQETPYFFIDFKFFPLVSNWVCSGARLSNPIQNVRVLAARQNSLCQKKTLNLYIDILFIVGSVENTRLWLLYSLQSLHNKGTKNKFTRLGWFKAQKNSLQLKRRDS